MADESSYDFNFPAIDQYVNPDFGSQASAATQPGFGDMAGALDGHDFGPMANEATPTSFGAQADAGASEPAPTGTKMHTMGLPDATDGSATPNIPNPGNPDYAQQQMLAAAQGVDNSLASGSAPADSSNLFNPQAAATTDPGTFSNAQATINRATQGLNGAEPSQQAAANGTPGYSINGTTPNLPNSGATSSQSSATSGTGAPGQTSDAQWQQDFQKANGFFNGTFDSRQNFLDNAQRGDMVIRGFDSTGQRTGPDQLAEMAKYDSDARRILDAINATPDFYRSQNTADWIGAHNTQIATDFAQGGGGLTAGGGAAGGAGFNGALGAPPSKSGNGYVTSNGQNLLSQRIPEIANPIDNAHALMTDQMRTGVQNALDSLGATNIKQSIDGSGNLTLDWVSKSGTPMSMKESLVNYANALEQLKGMAAPPAANPPSGGGGYPPRATAPRSFAPPRGGGGGYAPPQAPQASIPAGAIAGNQGAPSFDTAALYHNNPTLQGDYLAAPSFDNSNLQQAGATVTGYQPPTQTLPRRGQPY